MVEIVEQLQVDAPVDSVWSVLGDFAAIAVWAPNVEHSCLTTAKGSGVGAVRRVQVGRNAFLERTVEWADGESLGYEIEGVPPVVRSVINTWAVAEAEGGTLVTLTTSVTPAGPRPPQQVAARLFGRVLAKASRQMLAGLNAHLQAVSA